jgi:hypothetical protein
MKLCNIVPVQWLKKIDLYTNIHLILAQEVLKSSFYGDFYRRRCIDGDFIIVDNGAFEKETVSAEQIIEVAHKVFVPGKGTVEVVAPEIMGNPRASMDLLDRFITMLDQCYISYFRLMVVVQGKTTDEAIEFFRNAKLYIKYAKVPITWGVPKYLDENRPSIVRMILEETTDPIHLLGLAGASDRRIVHSRQIRSLDTSYASTIALTDLSPIPLDGGLRSPKRPPNFFNAAEPTDNQRHIYGVAYDWLRNELDSR